IVKFNGVAASVTSSSPTSLVVAVPASTTGKISVTRAATTVTSPNEFLVLRLTINNFYPPLGTAGTNDFINGSGFSTVPANNIVKFNGVTATITNCSPTGITAVVPAGNTAGNITVTVNGVTATSTDNFGGTLSVTAFTPSSGTVGSSVTISGTGF